MTLTSVLLLDLGTSHTASTPSLRWRGQCKSCILFPRGMGRPSPWSLLSLYSLTSWNARAASKPEMSKLFLKGSVSRYFGLMAIRSLLRPLNSAAVAWKQRSEDIYFRALRCAFCAIFTCHKLLFFPFAFQPVEKVKPILVTQEQ